MGWYKYSTIHFDSYLLRYWFLDSSQYIWDQFVFSTKLLFVGYFLFYSLFYSKTEWEPSLGCMQFCLEYLDSPLSSETFVQDPAHSVCLGNVSCSHRVGRYPLASDHLPNTVWNRGFHFQWSASIFIYFVIPGLFTYFYYFTYFYLFSLVRREKSIVHSVPFFPDMWIISNEDFLHVIRNLRNFQLISIIFGEEGMS